MSALKQAVKYMLRHAHTQHLLPLCPRPKRDFPCDFRRDPPNKEPLVPECATCWADYFYESHQRRQGRGRLS